MRLRLCDGLNSQYSYSFAMEKNVYGRESQRCGARKTNNSALIKINSFYEALLWDDVLKFAMYVIVRYLSSLSPCFPGVLKSNPLRLATHSWSKTLLQRHGKSKFPHAFSFLLMIMIERS